MALRMEWRRRTEGDETILAVETGSNAVVKTWPANTELLMDFLNDMVGLDPTAPNANAEGKSTNGVDHTQHPPQEWGDVVMSRAEDGDVLWVDPQLYWEGIAYWFRSRGLDPHPARPRT
jgi:hypothetical protein